MITQGQKIQNVSSDDSNQSVDLPSIVLESYVPQQDSNSSSDKALQNSEKESQEKNRKGLKMASELNKMYKPSECMKYMHLEIHPSLSKQWYAADINREVTATGAHVDIAPDLFDPALVLWYRRVPQELVSNSGQVELSEPKQSCDRALYITKAEDIEGFVHMHTLASEIGGIKDMVGCKLTLVIFGTKEYFKSSNRKTKNSKEKLMTNIDLEMAIADLLVSAHCDTLQVNTPNELALHIVQFTKAIAEEPFKRAKRLADEQADFYMRGDNKNCAPMDQEGNGVSRLWQQMIAVLPSSSLEISRTVCAQYKTPVDLYNACQSLNSERTIAEIAVSRTAVPGAKTRRLGPEFARKLRTLFTATDGNEILD